MKKNIPDKKKSPHTLKVDYDVGRRLKIAAVTQDMGVYELAELVLRTYLKSYEEQK